MSKSFKKKLEIGLIIFLIILFVVDGIFWIKQGVVKDVISASSQVTKSIALPNEEEFFLKILQNDMKLKLGGENVGSLVFQIIRNILLSEEEKVFLVLLQNNMELRPGGGYIGSFGIAKIKDKKIVDFQIHDTSNFDGRIPDTVITPYPFEEMLNVNSWKLRDSNYSPDFLVNAKKTEEFYNMGDGQETFDGMIAVNASVLESVLEVTGPIKVNESLEFNSKNVLVALEEQVEKKYVNQNIDVGDRKVVMNDLFESIMQEVENFSFGEKLELVNAFIKELDQKNIQLYFDDVELQNSVESINWAGKVNQEWDKDYLMVVDANLGGYKSDYFMQKKIDYFVDLSQEKPSVELKITYVHTAEEINWMVNNYQGYLRVYVPEGSWLINQGDINEVQFGEELNKKYFGRKIFVPVGETKTFSFKYFLPDNIDVENYDLLIQKQSGANNTNLKIITKESNEHESLNEFKLEQDFKFSEKIQKQ